MEVKEITYWSKKPPLVLYEPNNVNRIKKVVYGYDLKFSTDCVMVEPSISGVLIAFALTWVAIQILHSVIEYFYINVLKKSQSDKIYQQKIIQLDVSRHLKADWLNPIT